MVNLWRLACSLKYKDWFNEKKMSNYDNFEQVNFIANRKEGGLLCTQQF